MVPRQLIHEIICECPEAAGEQEAFLRVLLYANYKESVYRRNGAEYVCARGESLFSYMQWTEIFGWRRSRTMRFFKKMFDCKRLVHLDDGHSTHIRIPDYDAWIPRAPKKEAASATPPDNGFNDFWEQYHEITRKDKSRQSAQKLEQALRQRTYRRRRKHRKLLRPSQQHLVLPASRELPLQQGFLE